MTATAQKNEVSITAILNPHSGPGDRTDALYVKAGENFVAAHGHALAYVPSGQSGTTPASFAGCNLGAAKPSYTAQDVVNCAKGYKTLYPTVKFDGIFVDEMGPGTLSLDASINFYTQVYDGLKAIDSSWKIFANPGTAFYGSGYLRIGSKGGADTLVTFEDFASKYFGSPRPTYEYGYPSTRFANILHTAASNFDFNATLLEAQARNVSYLYVTDDVYQANPFMDPFDRLPTHWSDQVIAVRNFNAGK